MTPQRQVIFRLLYGNDAHPTVESLYERAQAEMPTMSLKTVYQTVHDLEALGEVDVLDLGTGSCASIPTSSTRTITSCAAAAAGCAISRRVRRPAGARPLPPRLHRRRGAGDLPRPLRQLFVRSPDPAAQRSNIDMPKLNGTQTHENLKAAFAGESQANRRYLYFAQKADVEGHPDVAALFRSVAEGETGHAFGHFDFLAEVGDPATGVAGRRRATDNLKSAVAGETYEYTEMYPGFAKTARDEGFEEIAEWLETLARAEKSHAGRFQAALESIS